KKLIKNNNGQLAKVIYDTMLINTQEYSNERIVAFRENNEDKESEVQDLLNFYQERLHSSAFNKNIFKEYQENKELEKEAVNIFKSSGEKVRTRPINHNFYSVSQELEKYSIYINTANINLVFAGSNELYIKEAELIPQTEYSFNFIYNPETKIISQVEWNSDIPMPSLNEHIPLKNFQESYNTLLNIELGTNEETEKAVIQDWSYEAEEMREIYNYEANIKKQLTKKELEKNKITSKHNYMDVLSDNTISIKNATLSFTREKEAKKDIHFDMELETGSWMVLHASFIEFPDANIAPSKLIDLSPLLIMSYQEEVEKNNIQNEAQKVFRSYNPDIQALDFTVTDKENGIVSFTNLPLFIEEEIWRVSGNYNSTTQVITEAQTEHKNEKIYLKEIKAHSLKNYLKDLNTETSKDVDDIILDSLLDENFFDEIDAEITEIQL
ncbi:hypothetical protein HON22_01465, partial [Candidatus Peregrinibacteria bacterium]|nr:hypothetical protein [Candidatus Peregrinibacteria bacterium]